MKFMSEQRKIIHVDADSFYASVETRENPALAGEPIAVGGRAERRGVIATANYEARKFGVHSAMASARALKLCPDLIIVAPRFELYRTVSGQFHEIFREFTELIEPLSLDEAYLDVSDCSEFEGSATLIAQEIRRRVREQLNLTVSAGVAPNKFLAKVASDWRKPDGQFTVAPGQVAEFVHALPVKKINGVGKVTAAKLAKMGVQTCGDLQQLPLDKLIKRFGKYGRRLSEVAQGIDQRQVQTSRQRKSISVERTYAEDIAELPQMLEQVDTLLQELAQRYSRIADRYLPTKRVVKIKFRDFNQTTREELLVPGAGHWQSTEDFHRILRAAWPRGGKPVRLLGVGLRLQPMTDSEAEGWAQMPLFED
jgi:DNA polymerase-4